MLLISPPYSYRLFPYLDAAQRLGLRPLVVSEGQHSLVSALVEGVHVDFSQPEAAERRVLEVLGERGVRGVVGTDDTTVELAARLGRRLQLPHNPVEAGRVSRRKDLARQHLAEAGVPVPSFTRLSLRQSARSASSPPGFPCVLKPLALSGSRGVIRVNDEHELWAALARIRAILDTQEHLPREERDWVLAESYVEGPEVAVEAMLDRGLLIPLAVFDKPDPLVGPFFEETIYVTPSRLDRSLQRSVLAVVADACRAYGLIHGPVHAELRLGADRPVVIEVAARTIGGECARLLRHGTGHGLEELVLSYAIGESLSLDMGGGAAGVMMIPIPNQGGVLRRVEGVLAARAVRGIEDVQISVREGYELVPLPEGASYLGFIYARGASPAKVEASLRQAHACLRVVTSPSLPVTGGLAQPPSDARASC